MKVFGLGIKGVEVRSDPLRLINHCFSLIASSSCRTTKYVRIGEKEEGLNWSVYTCGDGNMFCL
jgi:hypothetical protein